MIGLNFVVTTEFTIILATCLESNTGRDRGAVIGRNYNLRGFETLEEFFNPLRGRKLLRLLYEDIVMRAPLGEALDCRASCYTFRG